MLFVSMDVGVLVMLSCQYCENSLRFGLVRTLYTGLLSLTQQRLATGFNTVHEDCCYMTIFSRAYKRLCKRTCPSARSENHFSSNFFFLPV